MKTYSTDELVRLAEELLASRSGGENPPVFPDLFPWLKVVSADGGENRVDFAYKVKPWTANVLGICHGGVTATLADCCMGIVAAIFAGDLIPTISLNLQYVQAVPIESTVVARASVIHAGKSTVNTAFSIVAENDPHLVYVTGTGIYASSVLNRGK